MCACVCVCVSVSAPKPKKAGGSCRPGDGGGACDDANAKCGKKGGQSVCQCADGYDVEEDYTCSTYSDVGVLQSLSTFIIVSSPLSQ